jgi:SAM-dependent methyltransferase
MRDPAGAIRFEPAHVVRALHQPLDEEHFLRSSLARRWCDGGRLVAYDVTQPDRVISPRLPFVSYPHEWCDAQLEAAATFTLQLQKEAVAAGFDLKDASAWNVLFSGTRPVFCDLLSFVPLRDRNWWALGQYTRHFVLPLLLSKRRGLQSHRSFATWRDGVPPDAARRLIGWTRYLGRHWPLMARASGVVAPAAGGPDRSRDNVDLMPIARFRVSLHATLEWWLSGAAPPKQGSRRGAWGGYTHDRSHYVDDSLERKRAQVAQWLTRTQPAWVADLGCNTGEFSRMALEHGAQVIAVDGDHDSIQKLFTLSPDAGLHPVIAVLDDVKGGAGWLGEESPGLMARMAQSVDLVLMLALVHHLAVAASIPLDAVARMARRMSRGWLVVEFVAPEDPQMKLLCAQRQRDPRDFSVDSQRAAFLEGGFELCAELQLAPTHRTLALMKTRN